MTVRELAERLGGALEGDGEAPLTGVAILSEAGPRDVSWLGDLRRLAEFERTRAAAVLVPAKADLPPGPVRIRVADPDLALCDALRWLGAPADEVPAGVHPTAVISPGAEIEGARIGPRVFVGSDTRIGAGTQLHAGVYVGSGCTLGRDCVIWPNVVIRERSELGERVIVHANSTIAADGFGYLPRGGRHVKIPQIGRVVIEDDVEIGANSAIDRARSGVTRIGRGTKIDNLVQIGHNVTIGPDCIVVAQCGISGSTTLGQHVVLGGQVGLIDHLRIGDRVQLAAKSAVFNDLAADKVYRGIPASETVAFGRQTIGIRKLPELMAELRQLRKRVEQLESTANDRTRS